MPTELIARQLSLSWMMPMAMTGARRVLGAIPRSALTKGGRIIERLQLDGGRHLAVDLDTLH